MRWYDNLYIGEKAEEDREEIIEKIKSGKIQLNKYVLALPMNESDVLDIYPANILIQKHYMKSDLIIVGIADGKSEAEDLMQKIIMECYHETDDFKLKDYIISGGVSG